jgi:methylase of polypeptide subunit release factors
MLRAGFSDVQTTKDYAGHDRIVHGRLARALKTTIAPTTATR